MNYTQQERMAAVELAQVTRELPAELRRVLEDLPVHFRPRPDAAVAAEMGPDLLGLFSGEPLHERGETTLPTPPQIHLYLANLWAEAEADPQRFCEEVRLTFLHELGHYLGWEEDDMERYGID